MEDNLSKQPGAVDLSGAVDLINPVLKVISDFRETCVASNAGALILIGRGEDGNVFAMSKTPGGIVEQAGMISLGKTLLETEFVRYLHSQAGVKNGNTK